MADEAGTPSPVAAESPPEELALPATGSRFERQLEARLKAAIRTIPGTDTQYLVGGYLHVDGLATRRKQDGDEQDTFIVSTTPFGPADADYRLSVRQSQINWLSRSPTAIGPLWTRMQANLFPLDGSTAPTLNQLYVRLDDKLIVGKTYSTFMDDGALPTTLDYNGPSGVTFVRQWLARVSLPFGDRWSVQGAVEEAQAELSAGNDRVSVRSDARRPDLAARLRYEGERGHVQLAFLSRSIDVTADTLLGSRSLHVDGRGVSLSGAVKTFGEDLLLAQAATGRGVGRYFNDPLSATGVALGRDGFELLRTSGLTLYYQRRWAPDWLSVFGASTLWVSGDDLVRAPDELRRVVYGSANLVRRLSASLFVGGEVLWGEAWRVNGETATNVRVQVSVRYLIF
jgi:hypothetical protein